MNYLIAWIGNIAGIEDIAGLGYRYFCTRSDLFRYRLLFIMGPMILHEDLIFFALTFVVLLAQIYHKKFERDVRCT